MIVAPIPGRDSGYKSNATARNRQVQVFYFTAERQNSVAGYNGLVQDSDYELPEEVQIRQMPDTSVGQAKLHFLLPHEGFVLGLPLRD